MKRLPNLTHLCRYGSLIGVLCLSNDQVFARFVPEDADSIDREDVLDTEYYNTVLSYQYPEPWKNRWRDHRKGYRASSGSVGISTSLFGDDFKWLESSGPGVFFEVTQRRREDPIERITNRAIGFGAMPLAGVGIGLLYDGGTDKKFADAGALLILDLHESFYLRASYFSVDHFYNSKEDTLDRYLDKPSSLRVELVAASPFGGLTLEVEDDPELKWDRLSQGEVYEYRRFQGSMELWLGPRRGLQLVARGAYDEKQESRMVTNQSTIPYKRLERQFLSGRLGIRQIESDSSWSAGAGAIQRKADYRYDPQTEQALHLPDLVETPSVHRDEGVAFLETYQDLGSLGLVMAGYLNSVKISEIDEIDDGSESLDRELKATEVRFQLGFDVPIEKNSGLFFNTTWDLDAVVEDPGKFFGGGSIQVQFNL